MIQAAGILMQAPSGRVLVLQRSSEGDAEGLWSIPGGKIEDGESAEKAAVRETLEETGYRVGSAGDMLMRRIADDVDYVTFHKQVDEEFVPVLNEEHTAWAWIDPEQSELRADPGLRAVFARLGADELGIARLMAAGDLTSPQRYMNVTLVNLRITGTGLSYRPAYDEYVFRKPEDYLTGDFIARCNGLPVIMNHPKGAVLTSEEFASRIVGTVMLPYISGDEVWAIARIYDNQTIKMFDEKQISTSPAVLLDKSYKVNFDDDQEVLIEQGKPKLLDHIALCTAGVWDKGEAPNGVEQANIRGDSAVAEETKTEEMKKADAARADEKIDMLLKGIDSLRADVASCNSRLDSFEKMRKDAAEGEEEEEKKKADAAKKDDMSPDTEAERVAADKKRKDAAEEEERKKREDAARADGASIDALKREIDGLRQLVRQPVAEMDRAPLSAAQARADSVMIKFGDRAPIPLAGESVANYKKRIADTLKKHSDRWKDIKIDALDPETFKIVEEQVYADASERALRPNDINPGGMRAVESVEASGHKVTKFYGGPKAHFVKQFTTKPEQGWVAVNK